MTDQRRLFDLFGSAVERFYSGYFGEDGEPFWPLENHVGIDSFNYVPEGFYNRPLAYAMDGNDRFDDVYNMR